MISSYSGADVHGAFDGAQRLLREAAALLTQAAIALDAGDTGAVLSLLQRRATVLQDCEAPLAVVRHAAEADTASGPAKGLLARLVDRSAELGAGELRLALSLESERDRVGRELDQIEGDELVRSAYGKQTRYPGKINAVG